MTIKYALYAAIVGTFFLSGCSTLKPLVGLQNDEPAQVAVDDNGYELIAQNLVGFLAQLETTNPLQTTFQMVKPSTPFGEAVFREIEDRGYGIQLVSGDLGNTFLSYKAEQSQTESGFVNRYSINGKGVSLEREYMTIDNNVMPTSPISVRGSQIHGATPDDEIFEMTPESHISTALELDNGEPEVIVYASLNTGVVEKPKGGEFKNVFELKHSNYSSLFASYNDLERHVLVFPNDSLTLGALNKKKISSLANKVDPNRDIVSVIGCSHGKTAIKNGNQILAEGRTNRVRESLMFAGIQADIIYDEACWASKYWDEEAPRRGVMVTHKRIIDKG